MSALFEIIALSLYVSGIALIIACVLGIPLGAAMALYPFPGKRWAELIIYTGMGAPPVVVGLAVYMVFSRSGPLGVLNWLFTPTVMIVAQVVIALPVVSGLTTTAIESIDPMLRLQLRSLGATPTQVMWALLSEARNGVLAAVIAGFGSIISEVGAVMLVGGNIEGQTRVLTTAIVLETRKGDFGLALALGGVLLSLAFISNALFLKLSGRRKI